MRKILMTVGLGIAMTLEAITLSGSVISDNQKMITSRFMGFVKEVKVSEGERVKKGQLLYEIDSREIDAKKEQAQLGVEMYQNQYMNAKLNLDRYRNLLKKDMVSKFDVENLELGTKNLYASLKIAKARLKEVKNQYQYLTIKAPNAGVIIAKNIKVGEMAMPGMPAFILSDLSDLKITTEVAESDLNLVPYGKKVQVEIPSANIKTVGTISAIIPSSNQMTHSFRIKVDFKYNDKINPVYPGMYAVVNVE